MRKGAIALAAAGAVLAAASIDLQACGDKFLRIGRSPRLRHYGSIHPASLLVYQPANPDRKGTEEFEKMLTRAGHTVVFIRHGSNVAQTAAAGAFDLVIATYGDDANTVAEQLRSSPVRPDVMPIIVDRPSKLVEAQVAKEYACFLAPYKMTKFDALEEIDHAMETRLKALASSTPLK